MKLFETTRSDFFAISLPVFAAVFAVTSGVMALAKHDNFAAIFGIFGGLAGAAGVVSTYSASKTRDEQMRFWINGISDAESHIREGFGS